MSSTISTGPSRVTRRQFAGGVAALLACSNKLRGEVPPRVVHFGVFSLFEPYELTLQSTDPLLLRLDGRPYILPPDAGPLCTRRLADCRIAVGLAGEVFSGSHLSAAAISGGPGRFTLAVPPSAKHGGIRRDFRGTLEVRASPRHLEPIVSMDVETAVASIVSAETPPDAPPAFLMAQAVASRSFLRAARTAHTGFDFCDTTHCQYLRSPAAAGSPAGVAAARTLGLCLNYGALNFEGRPIAAMYCRSCSGRTRSLAELGLPVGEYPYYVVDCEFCLRHPETWERDFHQTLTLGSERGRLAYDRIHGWSAIPSNSFTQRQNQVEGRGIGHGLGLCQRGAEAMAHEGANFNEILAHYYPNTAIAPA